VGMQVAHDGLQGWVASWLLTPNVCEMGDPAEFCVTDTLCTDRLNVRVGPGGDYLKVGSLAHNAVAVAATGATSVDDQDRVWRQIHYGDGVAWVASWFLTGAPCAPSAGEPCVCPADGILTGFVHDVDPVGRIIWLDPFEGFYWEEGWGDSEAYPINDDPSLLRLPIADGAFVRACVDLDWHCTWWAADPGTYAEYDLPTFAGWIQTDQVVHQSDFWARYNSVVDQTERVSNANNQWWHLQLSGCSVITINAPYHP